MIVLSPKEAAQLASKRVVKDSLTTARKPRIRKCREDLPENQLEQQCLDYARLVGLIPVRQHVGLFVPLEAAKRGVFRPVKIGTKGMCDWRFELPGEGRVPFRFFEGEFKASGKYPTRDQYEYLGARCRQGVLAIWFSTFIEFKKYVDSWRGLHRAMQEAKAVPILRGI